MSKKIMLGTDRTKYCIHCGQELAYDDAECSACGKPVEKFNAIDKTLSCYFCDAMVSPAANYCPSCGHKVVKNYDTLEESGRKKRNKIVMDTTMKGAITGVVLIMLMYAFFFGGIRLSTFFWCMVYGAICFLLGGSGTDRGKYWDGVVTDRYAVERRHITFSYDKHVGGRRLRVAPYYHHMTHVQREDGRNYRFDELEPRIYDQLRTGDKVRFHKGIRVFEVLKRSKSSKPATIEKHIKPRNPRKSK